MQLNLASRQQHSSIRGSPANAATESVAGRQPLPLTGRHRQHGAAAAKAQPTPSRSKQWHRQHRVLLGTCNRKGCVAGGRSRAQSVQRPPARRNQWAHGQAHVKGQQLQRQKGAGAAWQRGRGEQNRRVAQPARNNHVARKNACEGAAAPASEGRRRRLRGRMLGDGWHRRRSTVDMHNTPTAANMQAHVQQTDRVPSTTAVKGLPRRTPCSAAAFPWSPMAERNSSQKAVFRQAASLSPAGGSKGTRGEP